MKTPKNLDVVLKALPEIVKAAFTAKNKERVEEIAAKSGEMYHETKAFIEDLSSDAGAVAHLVIEMLKEPLHEAGIDFDLPIARDVNKFELEEYLKEEIDKATKIIPFSPKSGEK